MESYNAKLISLTIILILSTSRRIVSKDKQSSENNSLVLLKLESNFNLYSKLFLTGVISFPVLFDLHSLGVVFSF